VHAAQAGACASACSRTRLGGGLGTLCEKRSPEAPREVHPAARSTHSSVNDVRRHGGQEGVRAGNEKRPSLHFSHT